MMKVIDVSTWQGLIDWEKVKTHIDGAILRCGYGSDKTDQDDAQFKRNADECTRLGIPFGVYLYSYAKTTEQAKSEAAHVLRLIKGYKLAFPVYLDLEEDGTQSGAIERANIFGDIIEKAGYWCGVYANLNWWKNHLTGLERFTKWVAQYYTECTYTGANLDMWQYSSSGTVPGIKGNVDMNECYRNFPAEILKGDEKPVEDKKPVASSFLPSRGYFKKGDVSANVGKIAEFMRKNFPAYTDKKALGNTYGPYIIAAITEFQRRTDLEADGYLGPLTLAMLERYGFRK